MTSATALTDRTFKSSTAKAVEKLEQANGFQTPRVLCIDDDPDVSRSIQLRLGRYGLDVSAAYFGTQGFWEATTNHPDLIIMDLAMPNGNGEFVLSSIRANTHTQQIPIIVLTGMRDPKLKKQILSAGADEFLTKPVEFCELLEVISRYVKVPEIPPDEQSTFEKRRRRMRRRSR
ncbi:response regulator [Stieleria sp. JC731]|uniref:response regulator n=1 Tax=Pirellulaceae TaxID=2691357 RepID=UPI001E5244AB|nr:response regulator [Stieleria sp. JC731]MCC9603288.1 response regulator [Stieleria sp. JC731]